MTRATSIASNHNRRNKEIWRKAQKLLLLYPDKTLREIYFRLKNSKIKDIKGFL